MIVGIASTAESSAALWAPLLAFGAEDVWLVALVIGVAAAIGVAVSVAAPHLGRGRDEDGPPDGVERRAVGRSKVHMADDPIVAALGLDDDDALRRRRRRRTIGGRLQSPPGDSAPPT